MSRKTLSKDYFEKPSAAMRETRKRVSTYRNGERSRLDELARSMMGQAVSVNVDRPGR